MTEKYKILIAEDEVIISETLKDYLEELGHEVIGIVSNVQEAIPYLDMQPDFAFLDIRMNGKDEGFNIAQVIHDNYFIPFLFLSSFSDRETIHQATAYQPSTFLVKPFTKQDIFAAFEIAITKNKISNQEKIHLTDGKRNFYINPEEIVYIQSEDKYINIHFEGKRIVLRQSLKEVTKLLPDYLIRCHRSFIINTNKIDLTSNCEVKISGCKIPVSKSFQDKI